MHAAEGKAVTLVCRVYSNPLARVCIMIEDTMKLIEGDQIHILDDHDVLDVDADHVDHADGNVGDGDVGDDVTREILISMVMLMMGMVIIMMMF